MRLRQAGGRGVAEAGRRERCGRGRQEGEVWPRQAGGRGVAEAGRRERCG